jgi:hypothetical protein
MNHLNEKKNSYWRFYALMTKKRDPTLESKGISNTISLTQYP